MFVRKLIGYFPSLLLKTRLEIHVYKRYQSVPSLATASFALKMNLEKNIAYLRYREEENRFETTFILDTDNVTFKKSICIVRPVDETIETYLSKIDHKVMQILEKKMVKKLKKKGKDEPVELPEVKSKFLQNNELVTDIKCETLFQGPPAENYKLRILDVEYNVTINSPWVESIKLPTEVYVGFTFFPIKFDAHSTDKELSEFVWFKSSDSTKKLSWNECGRGYCYTPKAEDAGHLLLLQCTPKNKYSTGPVCEIMSRPVLSFDHTCPFERRHTYTKEKTAPDEIRVVSYNILADIYAETKEAINNLFSYCKQEYLAITYRRPLIIKELQGYNADLICLQEVDSSLYYKCLKEIFSIYGFSSEMYEKGAAREGTAIFYDNQKFKMIKSLHHVLSEDLENNESLRDLYDKLKENEQLMFRCKRLGTTLQILALQSLIKPNEIILVGNTHLYFHPDADHIRLLQGVMCMKLLQIHLEEIKKEVCRRDFKI